jgi:hypothetical protein
MELMQLREQALEAGLRGSALYRAQEAAAIDELKFKDIDRVQAASAIHAKFRAEEKARNEEELRETTRIQDCARPTGRSQ